MKTEEAIEETPTKSITHIIFVNVGDGKYKLLSGTNCLNQRERIRFYKALEKMKLIFNKYIESLK